ncbi:hypothetical protein [Sediminicoccus sp. KRV36]|uniref:hypothetical protein n=1 Tax=Sediminicoccus sp. KRV36 TaxID=3133721 RepID=UPI00200F92CC|nr:hypothetical protein [Sediminicoccus rosea]UPY36439.1 hypothetical protein LHU95_19800 [Sediminicoccus rosea]
MPRWVIFLLLPLAACAGGGEDDAAAAAMAAHRASLEALGMPQAAASPGPRPTASAPIVTTPGWHASGLLGASPEAVRAALGEPLLRRAEGPAQIWLYTGGGCQLDIVLYTGEAGPRVAHIQARAGGIAQRTEASCLRDISAQATRPPAAPPTRIPSSLGQGVEFDV